LSFGDEAEEEDQNSTFVPMAVISAQKNQTTSGGKKIFKRNRDELEKDNEYDSGMQLNLKKEEELKKDQGESAEEIWKEGKEVLDPEREKNQTRNRETPKRIKIKKKGKVRRWIPKRRRQLKKSKKCYACNAKNM